MISRAKNQRGFTLMELMICIGIIGILASIAIPNYFRYRERGLVARAKADLETIAFAITMLAVDSGKYPSGEFARDFEKGGGHFCGFDGDDKGLTGACADFLDGAERWEGPYMKNVPKDPWGNDYWFDADWNNREDGWDYVAIGSCGPDGEGLNDYDDPDNIVKTISAPFDNSLN
jgi:general secretion pathway protein G